VDPMGPATRTGSRVRLPNLLELMVGSWRHLRPASRLRKATPDTVSDHVLAYIGLNGPGCAQPTWERHIHR